MSVFSDTRKPAGEMNEKLQKKLRGENPDAEQETPQEETQEVQQQETEQEKQERLLVGKYKSPEELERAYKELENKLGEQSQEIQSARQMKQYFESNPDAAQLLQKAAKGEIDPKEVLNKGNEPEQRDTRRRKPTRRSRKPRDRYGRFTRHTENEPQNKPQNIPQPQQNEQNDYKTELEQVKKMQQNILLNDLKGKVSNEYSQVKEQYGDLLEKEGLGVEDLTEIAIQHNLTKQGDVSPVPDIESALRVHMATNPDSFQNYVQTITQKSQQAAQQSQQDKARAQVESQTANNQPLQQQEETEEEKVKKEILQEARKGRGSGFLRK